MLLAMNYSVRIFILMLIQARRLTPRVGIHFSRSKGAQGSSWNCYFYWVATWHFITGLPMANPVEVCVLFVCLFSFFSFFFFFLVFFSVSVRVLPVTPLVSGVFVHRAFCAYFLRIERVVELRRFLWRTQ